MAQTIDTTIEEAPAPAPAPLPHAPTDARTPRESFVSELAQMSPAERVRGSRHTFTLRERNIYAALYPDEAPTIDGELEWIAATLE